MKLLITGASGFLGQYVVAEALRQNHHVRIVVRPQKNWSALPWADHQSVEVIEADLTCSDGLEKIVEGIEGVIHLVASKSSNFDECYQGTVVTTQNLLDAMKNAQVRRLIAISSFSVYDYSQLLSNDVLDESCPVEANPSVRDAYAQTKLLQEQVVQQFADRSHGHVTIIRPGMIYGKNALWNTCHGASLGPLWLMIGARALIPLTYVENCATAIVAALVSSDAIGKTINIVDDDLPTRQLYTQAITHCTEYSPYVLLMNWKLFQTIAQLSWELNQRLLFGKLKLPGLLIPARLNARFKPLRFSNANAKRYLKWTPRYSLTIALERCQQRSSLLLAA